MKKLALLFLLIFTINVSAQPLNETHKKIRALVESRDYESAAGELENLRKADKKIFELNNYDYLLARLSEKQGNFANAAANYQRVVNRNSVLKEYALWHLSQIARFSGNLFLERIYLRELFANAPASLIADAAKARIAGSHFQSKDYDSAIAALRANLNFGEKNSTGTFSLPAVLSDDIFGSLSENDAKTREDLVLLGKAYLLGGNADGARAVFNKLVDDLPNAAQPDDFALEGARGLDRLDAAREEDFANTAPNLADKEHLKRAEIYQFNRDFQRARLHYLALIAQFPKNPNVPMMMYQIGRGFVQERNFSEAVEWFERIQAEFPESEVSKDALSQAASAYARVNKPREAVLRYERYIEKYPDAPNLDRAFLNIIDVLRDGGEPTNALSRAARARAHFRGKTAEAVALFAQARIHLSQKDWQKALNDLEALSFLGDLGGATTPGGTGKDEIAFLKGFSLEQLSRFEEAIDAYLSVPDGRNSYYGWRASERLRALANGEKTADIIRQKFYPLRIATNQKITPQNAESVKNAAHSAIRLLSDAQNNDESTPANITQKESLLDILRQTYSMLPEYKKLPTFDSVEFGRREVLTERRKPSGNHHRDLAGELLFLGLYDEAAPELEISRQSAGNKDRNPETENQNYTLAVYYMRGDMANRAVAFIEPRWRAVPGDFQIELIPREQIELLYPAPYKDSLLKFAPGRDVDPRFVLSIMRQESRYRADVKSGAAARGLMQFISATSNRIAYELGETDFRQNDLYHPPTAILFGSEYLSNLFRQFPDQPQAVAASYNGGEDNMERWYKRANSNDADQYVPEILYAQTKDYVFKVMQNYRVYRMFYDESLKQETSDK